MHILKNRMQMLKFWVNLWKTEDLDNSSSTAWNPGDRLFIFSLLLAIAAAAEVAEGMA